MVGWEGYYEISNLGRVKSCERMVRCQFGMKRWPERMLSVHTSSSGYRAVMMARDGFKRPMHIHWLVCEAWHGKRPTPLHQVAHFDGDKLNNDPANLRWATPKENAADNLLNGVRNDGERNGNAILTDEEAISIRRRADKETYRELAAAYGVSVWTIGRIVRRERYKDAA